MIKQFYEKALPSQGVYCVAKIHPETHKITQKFVEDIDGLESVARQFSVDGNNVYVALASYDGYSRKAEDTQFLRSFFIDLDVGDRKGYATKEDALTSLREFVEAKELPPPVIIDSGTGIHAYWLFDEDVAASEWKPYAEKFKAFCLESLKIDPVVTADLARILRCPDTFNYKTDPPSPTAVLTDEIYVYSFDAFKEFLGIEEINLAAADVLRSIPKGLDEETKALMKLDNYETVFDKIAIRSMEGDGCEQIKWAIENRRTLPEPVWTAVLSIAQHCTDRDEAIHALSCDYPGYNWEETEKKANQRQGKPYSCEVFDNINPDVCDNCKHRSSITNPLALGKTIKIAKAESVREDKDTKDVSKSLIVDHPQYLFPYFRAEKGGIYFQPPPTKDKKGKKTEYDPVLVFEHELFPVERLYSKTEGAMMLMRLLLPKDPPKEFLLPIRILQSTDELKKSLLFHDIIPLPHLMVHMMGYLNKWGKYLASTVPAEIVQMQMGWTEVVDGKRLGDEFVVGNQMIKRNGTVIKAAVAPAIRSIAKMFDPRGTFEKWQECVQELNRPSMELHALGALTGFGAPLMNLTSTSGVTLSYTGESGNAKTGALMANLSTWGNPKDMWVLEATQNGLVTRYVTFKNIPYGLDEAHNKPADEVAKFVHAVSQGKAKIRMQGSINAEREHELVASSIAMLTSNQPMLDIIMQKKSYANGEMARMIELMIEKPSAMTEDPHLGRRVFDPLRYNYGHAGIKLVQGFYTLGEQDLLDRIAYWLARFEKDFGVDDIYRFYKDYVCAVFTGGMVANEFKIVDFELNRIYDRLLYEMINLRDNVVRLGHMDYEGLVGEFINKYYTGFLGINDGKVTYEPRTSLVGRMDVALGQVFISTTEFKKYLGEKQLSSREFEKAMKDKGILIGTRKMRLDSGWKGAFSMLDKNMNVNCYVFETKIPSSFFDADGHGAANGGT
jgi:hypothetical protein